MALLELFFLALAIAFPFTVVRHRFSASPRRRVQVSSPSRPGRLAVASRSPHHRVQVASSSRSFRVTVALVLRHRRVSVAPPSRSCRLCLAWPSSTPRLVVGSSDRRVSSPLVVGSRLSFSTGFFSFSCDHHFYFTISIFF